MGNEMVERVARAIAGCQLELGPERWRYCVPEARAAIEAMREPTDKMIDAMPNGFPSERRENWQAAIDAALTDGEG